MNITFKCVLRLLVRLLPLEWFLKQFKSIFIVYLKVSRLLLKVF